MNRLVTSVAITLSIAFASAASAAPVVKTGFVAAKFFADLAVNGN